MRFFYKLQPFENMRLRIRRVNINHKIRRLGKHLNHLQLLYIRIQQLKASFCCAKTSLLRGTTAIRGGADTFVFLSHEILGKFRALLFQKKGNRTRQIKQERRTSEAVRPFEPQLELPRMAGVVAETGFWKKPAVKELTRMSIP